MVKVIWDSLTSSSVTEALLKLVITTRNRGEEEIQIVLVTEKLGVLVLDLHQMVAEEDPEVDKDNQVSLYQLQSRGSTILPIQELYC